MALPGTAGSVFDTKLVKGPTSWDGTKTKWRHWASKLRGYMRGVSKPMAELMRIAAEQVEPEIEKRRRENM